jgi:hypothetical protein
MIKCRGFDHPLFGDVLQLEKNFKATLVKQYRDIIVSCYLEVSLRNAHNLSSPLGVLARDIPQHALIVIRQLLRDVSTLQPRRGQARVLTLELPGRFPRRLSRSPMA